jgi:hypothetical protein
MDLDVFHRMVLAALLAVTPGAVVNVEIDEDDDERTAVVSVTVRRAGVTARGRTEVALPLDGCTAINAMSSAVRSVLAAGA